MGKKHRGETPEQKQERIRAHAEKAMTKRFGKTAEVSQQTSLAPNSWTARNGAFEAFFISEVEKHRDSDKRTDYL